MSLHALACIVLDCSHIVEYALLAHTLDPAFPLQISLSSGRDEERSLTSGGSDEVRRACLARLYEVQRALVG